MKKSFQPRDLAIALKTAIQGVYAGLWTGQIKGRKVDGKWIIPASEARRLMQVKAERKEHARQRKASRRAAAPTPSAPATEQLST